MFLRSIPLAIAALLAVPCMVSAAPAINVQSFEQAPGLHDALFVRSAVRQDKGDWDRSWHLVSSLHYTRRPLVFVNDNGPQKLTQAVVGELWMVDLGGSVGVKEWTFEAAMPMAVVNRGGGPDLVQVGRASTPSFGDLRLGARRSLLSREISGLGRMHVAAMLGYAANTAADGSWLGSGGKQLDIAALGSWSMGVWSAHVNAGVRVRGREALTVTVTEPSTGLAKRDGNGDVLTDEALVTGSQIMLRAAVERGLLAHDAAGDELRAGLGMQVLAPIGDVTDGQTLLEFFASASYRLDVGGAFRAFAALSTAPTSGYGASQARVIAGLRFVPALLPGDMDGDGIDDRKDACPKQAEDRDGFEDEDGCPELDNDGDGVPDALDKCPLAAEDKDGFEDEDGCPDPDNDGDGVPDTADKCPQVPEDKDGFDDHDGCAEDDNDGDGIKDADDLCPTLPEDKNGFEDEDGCPDRDDGANPSQKDGRILLPEKVAFVVGRPELSQAGRKTIAALAAYLRKNPGITALEVRVHTDDNGDTDALKILSQHRADAIVGLLASLGPLPADKLSARGMGPVQPIASNATLRGRSQNRRVEVLIRATVPVAKK